MRRVRELAWAHRQPAGCLTNDVQTLAHRNRICEVLNQRLQACLNLARAERARATARCVVASMPAFLSLAVGIDMLLLDRAVRPADTAHRNVLTRARSSSKSRPEPATRSRTLPLTSPMPASA